MSGTGVDGVGTVQLQLTETTPDEEFVYAKDLSIDSCIEISKS